MAISPTKEPATLTERDDDDADKTNGKTAADAIDKDDPHKVEKFSKLGQAGD